MLASGAEISYRSPEPVEGRFTAAPSVGRWTPFDKLRATVFLHLRNSPSIHTLVIAAKLRHPLTHSHRGDMKCATCF
jgi:hypothetical protein